MEDYPDYAEAISSRTVTHEVQSGKHKGRHIEISSLTLGDFISAREQALQEFKRTQIKTWTENADLLPEKDRQVLIRDAFEKAAKLTAHDLPQKTMSFPVPNGDGKYKRDDEGELITRDVPVDYSTWWMSETPEGQLHMAWLSMRRSPSQHDISKNDVDEILSDRGERDSVANLAGELSQSRLAGNSEAPPREGRKERRKRRKDREKARRK